MTEKDEPHGRVDNIHTARIHGGVPYEELYELIEQWREKYSQYQLEEAAGHECADDLEELIEE